MTTPESHERVERALKRSERWDIGKRLLVAAVAVLVAALVVVVYVSVAFDIAQRDDAKTAAIASAASECRGKLNALVLSHAILALTSPPVTDGQDPNATPRGHEAALGLAAARRVLDDTCSTPAGRKLVRALVEQESR